MENSNIKVLFDHQIFLRQRYGGISRYFVELMKQFNSLDTIDYELSLYRSNNEYIKELFNDKIRTQEFKRSNRLKNRINYNINALFCKTKLSGGDYDVFHPTYYDTYFKQSIIKKPIVVTVHDLIHEILPQYFDNPTRQIDMKKEMIERADHFIAISENTKKDLIDILGIDERRITTIYHGGALMKVNNIVTNDNLDRTVRYILFVGERGGYKNFDKFIYAVAELLRIDNSLTVKCVGGGIFTPNEIVTFRKLGIEKQVSQEQATDQRLIELYSSALAFVFPSLYEGFGIPTLEAMACGCPAILSNTSSFPEVGGGAAEYFYPDDENSIKKAISKVIYDEAYRTELIGKGIKQLEKFSWEKCAKETLETYKILR